MTSRRLGQHSQVVDRLIGHRVRFQIVPGVFDGIQLRSIGRQELGPPLSSLKDVGLNDPRPMGQETIP